MNQDRLLFLLVNIGHFLAHLFMLIFAGVAALALITEWDRSYSELLTFATPGFVAFGLFAFPAGWLADKWSRDGMMFVFLIGSGLASIATSLAETPFQLGAGLFAIGTFSAIYHPVGLALITARWKKTGMRLAINGVWGNLGVASAALITGYLIDHYGWRSAFLVPGLFSTACGLLYMGLWRQTPVSLEAAQQGPECDAVDTLYDPVLIKRSSVIIFVTTAVASVIFQSTTFALPKVFDERLQGISAWLLEMGRNAGLITESSIATMVGFFTFMIFALSSIAQLLVGTLLDRFGPRLVFFAIAIWQLMFFSFMPGSQEGWALVVTFGFMLGAFGQIPINDFMIGNMARGPYRARVYGIRYVVSFSMMAATLPMISFVYKNGGFDMLFRVLACAAFILVIAVWRLPPQPVRT